MSLEYSDMYLIVPMMATFSSITTLVLEILMRMRTIVRDQRDKWNWGAYTESDNAPARK